LGKFDHIKNAALKAARIGQNMSTGKSLDLSNVKVEYGKDEGTGKYLYTDGIGKISPDLVKKIRK
jgi:phosphoribosylaminoimidazole-succinocarboxamide synthase